MIINIGNQKTETLTDYIRWRGDLTFRNNQFQLLDSLVFTQLSYVDFSMVLDEPYKEATLGSLDTYITDHNCYRLKNLIGGEEELFHQIARSKRFKDIIVRNYIDVLEDDVQFCAMEFVINQRLSFIAYRGTDNTLVGWKEDFKITYTKIKAQSHAREYLKAIINDSTVYYVGGHSKGANLALYACGGLDEKQYKRILRIFDLDGPGFCKDTFDRTKLDLLNSKVIKMIPEYCVVGKMFYYPFENVFIVRSKESGANQHDLVSWCMDGLKLDVVKENDKRSEWITSILNDWIDGATYEERELFIDEFFTSLSAGGATTMQEILTKDLVEVARAMVNASPTSRKIVLNLAEVVFLKDKKNTVD